MDLTTLADFRRDVYACFGKAADALMNAADALLTETSAQSLAELSLSPFFERQWPSLYEAFQDATIDRSALKDVVAKHAPMPKEGQRPVLGGDASSILRTHSPTARDRTYVHESNLPEGTKPVRPGWQYSLLALLPDENTSWVYPVDNERIPSTSTQGEVMAQQLREARLRLAMRFLFLGDGYYGSLIFLLLTMGIDCDVLVRFSKNRVLYRDAPELTGKAGRGHPTWHGAPFKLKDPKTHGTPDATFEGADEAGHRIEVRCWHNLHFKKAHTHHVSLYQVIRHGAKDTKRDPKSSWFLFWGQVAPEPCEVPVLYERRYHLEHGYRSAKQDLMWEKPRFRTPEQFSVWTDIVSVVRNELFLARDVVEAVLRPWESKLRRRTPEQVRRGMGRIIMQLGTPARGCRPRGYSPGWTAGRPRQPVTTYKVVFKAVEKAPEGAKSPPLASQPASVAV